MSDDPSQSIDQLYSNLSANALGVSGGYTQANSQQPSSSNRLQRSLSNTANSMNLDESSVEVSLTIDLIMLLLC